MTQDELKKLAGWSALKYVKPDTIIGIGTGSTAAHFIDALATIKHQIKGTVSSSEASTRKLAGYNIPILDCNDVDSVDIYVDGADEINAHLQMVKGGGAALTREKIVAALAKKFVCIVDESKVVETLGNFPIPIEVIPMARSYVAREIFKLGGKPIYRQGILTDNGNVILDIHDLVITDPLALERKINNLAGVVTVGLFANRAADVALVGTKQGIKEIVAK